MDKCAHCTKTIPLGMREMIEGKSYHIGCLREYAAQLKQQVKELRETLNRALWYAGHDSLCPQTPRPDMQCDCNLAGMMKDSEAILDKTKEVGE